MRLVSLVWSTGHSTAAVCQCRKVCVAALIIAIISSILSCQSGRVERISGEFKVTYLEEAWFNYNLIGLESSDGASYLVLSERVFLDPDTLSRGCSALEVGNTYRLTLEERHHAPQLWTTGRGQWHWYETRDMLWESTSDTTLVLDGQFNLRSKAYESRDIVDIYALIAGEACPPYGRRPGAIPSLISEAIDVRILNRYYDDYWLDGDTCDRYLALYGECLADYAGDSLRCLTSYWAYVATSPASPPDSCVNYLQFLVVETDDYEGHVVLDYPAANIRCDMRFRCWRYGWLLDSWEIRELEKYPDSSEGF